MEVFAGIDEAGRGAVIGPLVVAGVSVEKDNIPKLQKIGVKDSKLLSPQKREILAKKIQGLTVDIIVVIVSACKIDNLRAGGVNLNRIETTKFADIITLLNPTVVYVDSHDVRPDRLERELHALIKGNYKIVAEHKADVRYPVVAAASIIAKVTRDKEIKKLHKEFGDFGPGYSSNEHTITWMKNWIAEKKEWPDIVRKSWETSKQIKDGKRQQGITRFFRRSKKEDCVPK